jgi:hypothetical protein
MHVSFALFADAANLSQEGKLNILGVFDAVQVATMPTVHPRATLVLRLKGSGADIGRHTVSLRWLNPSGSELWSSLGELDVGAAAPPQQMPSEMDLPLIAAIDLPLDEVGGYTMQIALDDQLHASVKLQVRMGAPVLPASGMVS